MELERKELAQLTKEYLLTLYGIEYSPQMYEPLQDGSYEVTATSTSTIKKVSIKKLGTDILISEVKK